MFDLRQFKLSRRKESQERQAAAVDITIRLDRDWARLTCATRPKDFATSLIVQGFLGDPRHDLLFEFFTVF